ncbi:MAG TPA: hypothetical protein DCR40_16695 [Prolixibacteraceae bacterium]|nr:hypothetical protein [Prolixibacteraceae bacterium]
MQLKKLFSGLLILISMSIFADTIPINREKGKISSSRDSLLIGIDYLKKYIQPNNHWQSDNPEIMKFISGLIHFAENEPIDTILVKLEKIQKTENFRYINRLPEFVNDSLKVPGYHSYPVILEKMKQLDRAIWNGVDMKSIPLPENLIAGPDGKIPAISELNLDSAITAYRKYAVRVFSDSLQAQLRDSLNLQNKQLLIHYNDSIVRSVNDSINHFVQKLQRYARNDSVLVRIQSISGKPTQVWLRNNQRSVNRLYIKNEQNDSLAIRMMNLDKYTLGIAIDDDVTFSRLAQKQRRDFVFEKIKPEQKLTAIQRKYQILTPWDLGGNGTFGFTQTYLNNWKAGGKSAFSFLSVLKGYANYSNTKWRWENTGELRNGWIRQGGDVDQTQKNDDKLELISRLGISAFKKWYYSGEIDFITQFFNGYNYPDNKNPISSYMSPAKTLIKLGLDYKPNKNFSLFISPLTAKYVFVRDTALIDQTRFGVPAGSRGFWEPGLNADLRYKIDLTPRISYETKYKMFLNYQEPFKKVDINWENTVVAQLTDRINMTLMLYMLYDDNVTFDTGKTDTDGKAIFKPKWQTRELMTIGFSYKISKRIYKQKKLG